MFSQPSVVQSQYAPSKQGHIPSAIVIAGLHGNAAHAEWALKNLEAIFVAHPGKSVRLWMESITPTGVPSDLKGLMTEVQSGRSRLSPEEWLQVTAIGHFTAPTMKELQQWYDESVRQERSRDHVAIILHPLFQLALAGADRISTTGKPHAFFEFDARFFKGLGEINSKNFKFKISSETTPFDVCVDLLVGSAATAVTLYSITSGNTGLALTALASALYIQSDTIRKRDIALAQDIKNQASSEEITVVIRGTDHEKTFGDECRSQMQDIVVVSDGGISPLLKSLPDLRLTRQGGYAPHARAPLLRHLIDLQVKNTVVQLLSLSSGAAGELPNIAERLPDAIIFDWERTVASRQYNGDHGILLYTTLQWLISQRLSPELKAPAHKLVSILQKGEI